jgi:hypothetical protein
VLLTAFGAWLAALPLIGLAAVLLADALRHGTAPYIVGAIALVATIYVLRRPALPLFVEQLLIPALIVGAALLAFGLFRDLPPARPRASSRLVAVASAWRSRGRGFASSSAPRRRPGRAHVAAIGTAAASARASSCSGSPGMSTLMLWLLAGMARASLLVEASQRARGAALESLRAGWLLATLAGLAWWSGMTFLAGASLAGGPFGEAVALVRGARRQRQRARVRCARRSLLLALAAAGWAARCWPALRHPAAPVSRSCSSPSRR